MSAEAPAATTPNTRTPNMHNTKPSSASGMSRAEAATVRDLNAHEWSQAVIDELQHIQVATPPIKDVDSAQFSEGLGDSQPRRFAHESGEFTQKGQYGYNQRNAGQLEAPRRPQAGTMDSTATIDIVKQIPGSW
ncbi:hypothetical protein TWF506_009409 [Arthrobotrys conoides]|uniref:Uncharacterized protein n=1 Tax=Arthrobotrys conoides TaxID=74498 RepID=A0AAN8PES8_9PEZI